MKLKSLLFALGVFVTYLVIVVLLRLYTKQIPENAVILNFFSKNDFFIGLLVTFFVTLAHEQKKRLK
ncbi:MAG TPA: hypothetical protein P5236_04730 [Paludibacteraceae bacterium]|nr:hypothetical protein [Paludibacteraceae bacterium]HOK35972.1 hypothetical protein [Paludibacteraceae bacterium]HOL00543.1 hypothetical protein [Paludibacteraceae bacterium]HPO66877.1 hypothetical protein [Paludibacteraceae bacterium]HRU63701.1 hypothetical protein [Paludibacteraceae bacterium]